MVLNQSYLQAKLSPWFDQVVVLEQTQSTNEIIKHPPYNKANTLVLARDQVAGKGTGSRTFYGEKDKGIYASFLLDVSKSSFTSSFLTLVVGCALVKTLEHYGINPQLKWVNDVLIEDKKVAGILCEKGLDDPLMVVGIGLNVFEMDFPSDISESATTVSKHTDKKLDMEEIIITLFEQVFACLAMDVAAIRSLYWSYYVCKNQPVVIVEHDQEVHGIIYDIDDQGRLIIKDNDRLVAIYSMQQIKQINNKNL